MKRITRLLMVAPFILLLAAGGCGGVNGQIRNTSDAMARTTVRVDEVLERERPQEEPVYIDGESIRQWLSQGGYRVSEENAQDKLFAALEDHINHTDGFYVVVPAGSDGRPELRARRNQADFRTLQRNDGSYPYYVEVTASEAIRSQNSRFGSRRDRREGGSAWVDVSIRLLRYDGLTFRTVASGHGSDDFKSFLTRPFARFGQPYDPVYESAVVAIGNAYKDLLQALETTYYAEVQR